MIQSDEREQTRKHEDLLHDELVREIDNEALRGSRVIDALLDRIAVHEAREVEVQRAANNGHQLALDDVKCFVERELKAHAPRTKSFEALQAVLDEIEDLYSADVDPYITPGVNVHAAQIRPRAGTRKRRAAKSRATTKAISEERQQRIGAIQRAILALLLPDGSSMSRAGLVEILVVENDAHEKGVHNSLKLLIAGGLVNEVGPRGNRVLSLTPSGVKRASAAG
ncbi:hypothetical protein J2X16_000771 [Pelomonas aquatica]|uniref:Uncharacterized protein n=1 Tax=Pelomonas aquatica TaxID=431058 RepID=A0ABU1Z4C5_9BURK|nr:hypothetical protein [Pelomonas aquatica]MDR7295450.1 hypothetical protein [Pelomonas aquatica]